MNADEMIWNENSREWPEFRPARGWIFAGMLVLVSLLAGASVLPEEEAVVPGTDQTYTVHKDYVQMLDPGQTDGKAGEETGVTAMLQTETALSNGGISIPVLTDSTDKVPVKQETGSVQTPGSAGAQEPVQSDDSKTQNVQAAALSYTGSLRQDYCTGSSPDLSGITVFAGGQAVSSGNWTEQSWDFSVPGRTCVSITVDGGSVKIPCTVVGYKAILHGNGGILGCREADLWNYRLSDVSEPVRPGYLFTGWYKDPACTVPFEQALPGETSVDLYAGWNALEGFDFDERGYITEYDGAMINDGLLVLPDGSGCTGICAGAFEGLSQVYELYIPADMIYIEKGAFSGMENLCYIQVSPDNPVYGSENGRLYKKQS